MKQVGQRILMTADAVGGVWSYASDLAAAMCEHGDTVMLVVMGPPPSSHQIGALSRVPRLAPRITTLALEWMDPAGEDLEHSRDELLRIADEFRPDVVHLNTYREGIFEWPAPVLIAAHSCVQTWWGACRGGPPREPQWRRYSDNVAAGLANVEAWVSPTAAFAREIAAAYRPPKPGRVIMNGFTAAPCAGSPKEGFILGAGRIWDEAKNLKALAACAQSLPWPVRIAGPRQEPNGSQPSASQDKCLGALSRPELLAEMRRAAVFVSPALYEPFGLSVLEAAASGCALILSNLPSFRELWNGAALFVDPRNAKALAATINTVCRNELLRNALQEAARARARRYRQSAMTDAYRRFYSELTSDTLHPAPPLSMPRLELQA